MTACASIGTYSKMLVQGGNSPRTFNGSSERTEFVYESLGSERKLQTSGRLTGTRSTYIGASRNKSYLVKGAIALQPGPAQLGLWLPRIFGGAPSGSNYPLAETLPEFDVIIDREGDVFTYKDLQVAQAVFRGQTSNGGDGVELIDLVIVLVGRTELDGQVWPVDAAEITDAENNIPYNIWEGLLDLDGDNLPYDKFNLMIDNHLLVKFRNSLTAQCIRPTGRTIRLETDNPFNADTIGPALELNTTHLSGSLKFTMGNMSTEFTFPALRNEFKTPTVQGRNEIPLNLQLQAFRTADDPEITITHDQTV
jgi:hypothetical protein